MFDTVIFVEKPAQARRLAPHLAQQHDANRTLVMSLLLTGPYGFNYPRGLKRADYPRVTEPQYKLRADYDWHAKPLSAYLPPETATPSLPKADILALLQSKPALVYAGDPDASGIHAFWLLARELCGLPPHDVPAYISYDLSDEALAKAVSVPSSTMALDSELEAAFVKRYFDWNWNQNALVAFGPALQQVAPGQPMLSKYALQVLYFCQRYLPDQNHPPLSEIALHQQFRRWTGTGKYPPGTLGSATSQDSIVRQLQTAGLLSTGRTLRVLPAGEQFLSFLHKGCIDLDLPQRLKKWVQSPLHEVKSSIDAYMARYFARQLRYRPATAVAIPGYCN